MDRDVLIRKADAQVLLCRQLGLLVNESKSQLVPSQSINFLVERLGLETDKAFPTQESGRDPYVD